MIEVSHSVAIIKPKQPYVDWVLSLPESVEDYTIEEAQQDCDAYLIPEYGEDCEALAFVRKHYEMIFGTALFDWYTDEAVWPKNRTWKVFCEWFTIELHSVVYRID